MGFFDLLKGKRQEDDESELQQGMPTFEDQQRVQSGTFPDPQILQTSTLLPQNLKELHENVLGSFMKVKEDIHSHNQWLQHLHVAHESVKKDHEQHVRETREHISQIYKWTDYLHQHTKKQQKDLKELENHLRDTISIYNEHIIQLYNKHHQLASETEKIRHETAVAFAAQQKEIQSAVKQEILIEMENTLRNAIDLEKEHFELTFSKRMKPQIEEALFTKLKEELNTSIKTSSEKNKQDLKTELTQFQKETLIAQQPIESMHLAQVTQKQEVEQQTPFFSKQHLTNPEIKLLNYLFNQTDPANYSNIAVKTGNSVNTVRVNMNLLKKKGFVEDHTLPTGVKLFSVKNKEKIKRMYNLEVIH